VTSQDIFELMADRFEAETVCILTLPFVFELKQLDYFVV
jgi:hypothetical protein